MVQQETFRLPAWIDFRQDTHKSSVSASERPVPEYDQNMRFLKDPQMTCQCPPYANTSWCEIKCFGHDGSFNSKLHNDVISKLQLLSPDPSPITPPITSNNHTAWAPQPQKPPAPPAPPPANTQPAPRPPQPTQTSPRNPLRPQAQTTNPAQPSTPNPKRQQHARKA